ncbi:MAG: lysylphosphatidylglycerol synthase transmembrane domain-containing protein [Gemmatimonadota bacterium]
MDKREQRPDLRDLSEPGKRSARDRWILAARTFVTLALLGSLLWVIDLSASIQAARQVRVPWFVLAICASALGVLVSVLKWERLVRDLRLGVSRLALVRLYLVGLFASSLLPGMVGGDVVRWQGMARRSGRSIDSAATIVAERAIGVMALVLCAAAAVAIDSRLATPPVLLLVAGMALAVTAGLSLALNRRLATSAMLRLRHTVLRRVLLPLYRLHKALRRFRRGPLVATFGFGVLFYFTTSLTFFLVLRSFGVELGYGHAFAIQVLTNLLTLLPISIGGLGLLQAGDVYLLSLFGVDAHTAFALSIARQMIHYGWGFVGGSLLFEPGRRRGREREKPSI